jgi:hypothetical protein
MLIIGTSSFDAPAQIGSIMNLKFVTSLIVLQIFFKQNCEEIEQNEETTAISQMNEMSQVDNEETNPHEDSISYDQPTANEETSKSNKGSEDVSEGDDVPSSETPLILEEAYESAYNKEEIKEEAQYNQVLYRDF